MVVGLLEQHCVEGTAHGCVGGRRATPAFHCRRDNLYCAWSRSLFASDRGPWNSGFEFPNVTSGCTIGAGLRKRSYPVYMASVGLSGAGVPGGGRADEAENGNTAKEEKVALPWDLPGTDDGRVWTDAACVT